MIDTHCHIDLHDNPLEIISALKASEIECVATTMLPSHYRLGLPHLKQHKGIHPSLGLHPMRAREGKRELADFIILAETADYIGEIGLDFSREGNPTKNLQVENLAMILPSLKGGKFVSVHSRESVSALLTMLSDAGVAPVCFHYFTGGPMLAQEVIQAGHYFSFNHRMLNGRHKTLLNIVPQEKVLVESDSPFLSPPLVLAVYDSYLAIARQWGRSLQQTQEQISANFESCRTEN